MSSLKNVLELKSCMPSHSVNRPLTTQTGLSSGIIIYQYNTQFIQKNFPAL